MKIDRVIILITAGLCAAAVFIGTAGPVPFRGDAAAQGYRPTEPADPASARPDTEGDPLDQARVGIGRLRYGGGGDWYGDPSSLPNLLREFNSRTGIRVAASERIVGPGDADLYTCPFLYMTGHGNVRLSGQEISNLRRHLLQGGFLYADDNYGLDKSFRRMVAELFPERELVTVPLDHPIYHCFYQMDGPPKIHEHDGRPPAGLGIFDGDRLMVFYTVESDIGDGLEDPEVHQDPPGKREQAARMAVNVLYYALTR
ncbi:MAG TPA: DUF4159 domain-containing protein [Candidatus Krumholzibacterium sp.]|nr:DUF4159 domain-containing protein [Candidatus Krumholzibacterium sp.]